MKWKIHKTLYHVSCIEYTWLFMNGQREVVLCISYTKCIFLAFKQFDSTKPIKQLKNMKEICISVLNFYMKTINNKHPLLFNCPTIHTIQRYNSLCELTNYCWLTLYIQNFMNAYTVFRQAFLLIQYSFICKQYFFCSDGEYQYFFDRW